MLVDVVFPPRCASCHGAVEAEGNFCGTCFAKLRMISAPLCTCCGIPFVVSIEDDMQCPACLEAPPAFTKARAAMVYDAVSAPLVSALKFADQWAGLKRYGKMMAGAGSELLKGADILVPVPLHRSREMDREFNQSWELCQRLAQWTGIPLANALARIRETDTQASLDREERLRNLRGAFALRKPRPWQTQIPLLGRRILLVDDVFTTGATLEACARALNRAGAAKVHAVALARVVRPLDVTI